MCAVCTTLPFSLFMSSFCSVLCTQPRSNASKASDTPIPVKSGTRGTPKSNNTPAIAKRDADPENDGKPLSYRGKPITNDFENAENDADLDDNEQDKNDDDDDGDKFLNEENTNDDVMEKVFKDERKRRMDLLGDLKEMQNQMGVCDNSQDIGCTSVFYTK